MRTKHRQLGSSVVVVRFRDGICTTTCYQCGAYRERYGWRRAVRAARAHVCPPPIPAVRYGLALAGLTLDAIAARRRVGGGH